MTHDPANILGHTAALGGGLAATMGWLQPTLSVIALLFTILFYGIKCYQLLTDKKD